MSDLFEKILAIGDNENKEEREARINNFKQFMQKRVRENKKSRIQKSSIYQKQMDIISSCIKSIMYLLEWSERFDRVYNNVQDIDKIDFKVIINFIDITFTWMQCKSDEKLHNELSNNIINAMITLNVITNKANRIKTLNNI